MKIQLVYETSKGLFWSKKEALKLKNRARDSARETDGDGYEPVREAYILLADIEVDQGVRGIGNETKMFKLKQLESYEVR